MNPLESLDNPTDWRQYAVIIAVVSLVWNLANTVYSVYLEKKRRKTVIRLEEFRSSVRDPLVAALKDCRQCAYSARSIALSQKGLDEIESETFELNRATVIALSQLSDALDDANGSKFSADNSWLTEFSDFEDNILTLSSRGCEAGLSEDVRKKSYECMPDQISRLNKVVRKKIDKELEKQL